MKKRKALREKILKGVQKAIDNLILERQQNDDYLIVARGNKIVKIKARKLKQKA